MGVSFGPPRSRHRLWQSARVYVWFSTSQLVLRQFTDPYPWALEECFDVYQVLVESQGAAIGMSGKMFNVILTGDSAYVRFYSEPKTLTRMGRGANIICGMMFKILESPRPIQRPCALVFNYAYVILMILGFKF